MEPHDWLKRVQGLDPSEGFDVMHLHQSTANTIVIEGLAALVKSITQLNRKLDHMADKVTELVNAVDILKVEVADNARQTATAVTYIQTLREELVASGVLSAEQQAKLDQAMADIGAATSAIAAATTTLDAADDPTPPATPTA